MSSRDSPSRLSASVTVVSLSEPNALMPMTPPRRSAAVRTPGAVNNVKRMTLLSDATSRRSPPPRLIRTTEESPTCMMSMRPAASSCAPRLPPFVLRMSTFRPWARNNPPSSAIQKASTVFTASEMPTLSSTIWAAPAGLAVVVTIMPSAIKQSAERQRRGIVRRR
jgi:hypothetical protein